MGETIPAVVKNHRDTAANLASANITPLNGEFTIESDTGNIKVGDEATQYNSLPYVVNQPVVTEITTGSNTTITLPTPDSIINEITYKRYGSGAGALVLNCPGSIVLNWGDAETTTVSLEGSGSITIYGSNGKLHVKAFEDSGSNANGYWAKGLDGTLRMRGIKTFSVTSQATVTVTTTLPKNVNDYTKITGAASMRAQVGGASWLLSRINTAISTSVDITFTDRDGGLRTDTSSFMWEITERWRT